MLRVDRDNLSVPWQIISDRDAGYGEVHKWLEALTYPDVELTTGPNFEIEQNVLEQCLLQHHVRHISSHLHQQLHCHQYIHINEVWLSLEAKYLVSVG